VSYSRWGSSFWYTYWLSSDEDTDKYNQRFCIQDFTNTLIFTYADLSANLDAALESARKTLIGASILADQSEELLIELKGYMESFMKDVDKEFGE